MLGVSLQYLSGKGAILRVHEYMLGIQVYIIRCSQAEQAGLGDPWTSNQIARSRVDESKVPRNREGSPVASAGRSRRRAERRAGRQRGFTGGYRPGCSG